MIPQATVNEILDATRIVDVIGDFVTLKRRGANWIACCPFHNEKTPSFYVSPTKGIYKCFGCGKAGSAITFLMEHESMTYPEALRWLADKYHIKVEEKEESAEEIAARQRTESLYVVTDFAEKFFQEALRSGEGRDVGLQYFHSRGLEDSTIEKYGLGWAPSGRHALLDEARARGYNDDYLVDADLCVRYDDGRLADKFFGRVTFPIHSLSGRVIGFGARTLESGHPTAKYINSKTTDIYLKERNLYGLYFAKNGIAREDKCILVEGYLDALSMHQLGITNVVASSGTSLTEEQCKLIHRFTQNVTIMYDGDKAGINAALRGINLVLREGLNVKVVLLDGDDDPDSFARAHTLQEVQDFIRDGEKDFIEFKTDFLLRDAGNDPLKRAALINDIADTIANIPDEITRSVYTRTCAQKFDIGEDIIAARVKQSRGGIIENERKAAVERHRQDYEEGKAAEAAGKPLPSVNRTEPDPFEAYVTNRTTASSEEELLEFVLRSGDEKLEFETDSPYYAEETATVAQFIYSAVRDNPFSNLAFRKVLDSYMELSGQGLGQEDILRHMLFSPDDEVRNICANLGVARYRLTIKNFEDSLTATSSWLVKYVPRSIMVYNAKCLESRIESLKQDMTKATQEDELTEIITQIQENRRWLGEINQALGREKKNY